MTFRIQSMFFSTHEKTQTIEFITTSFAIQSFNNAVPFQNTIFLYFPNVGGEAVS